MSSYLIKKMNVFSENLKKYRKNIGFSQSDLAERLGVKPNTISNYEKGVSQPDIDMLIKIIKILDTSADLLLGLNDTSVPILSDKKNLDSFECRECKLKDQLILQQTKTIEALETIISIKGVQKRRVG